MAVWFYGICKGRDLFADYMVVEITLTGRCEQVVRCG